LTTRPGQAATELLRLRRGKRQCHLIRVVRRDGQQLRLTDHDRRLTFQEPDGVARVYTPIAFGELSADRREAAFRSGNQEVRGIIDGDAITVPDLEANRYRGAEVFQVIVDWERPWIVYARHRRWIRSVVRMGAAFVGTLEGRAQQLGRPAAGRFGGTFTQTCTYELGDPATCKADIAADTIADVEVETVIDDRRVVEFTAASWAGTYIDNFYRDGSIEWTSGDNAGTVSPIVSYTHTDRHVELLIPTPKPIQVGDLGIATPGCDGLLTTCKAKFGNQLNFGQDPFAPSAQQIIEPPEAG
jgi:uncharacterized phage protein (TIGR02218 family)